MKRLIATDNYFIDNPCTEKDLKYVKLNFKFDDDIMQELKYCTESHGGLDPLNKPLFDLLVYGIKKNNFNADDVYRCRMELLDVQYHLSELSDVKAKYNL